MPAGTQRGGGWSPVLLYYGDDLQRDNSDILPGKYCGSGLQG